MSSRYILTMNRYMVPTTLLVFLFFLAILVTIVEIDLIAFSFQKLGLSLHAGFLLLFLSLIGSVVNIPLFSVRAQQPPLPYDPWSHGLFFRVRPPYPSRTIIAINVGGCVIPMLFSLHLVQQGRVFLGPFAVGVAVVAFISYLFGRPVPGLGIGMPAFIAPICAALVGILIGGEHSAPLAYVCGTLGVLIGADLCRLRDIGALGTPLASIGGAGTYDGIFITSIVAALLA